MELGGFKSDEYLILNPQVSKHQIQILFQISQSQLKHFLVALSLLFIPIC